MLQQTGFNISNIRFSECTLGSKELKVRWQDMTDYIRLSVLAGPPTKLLLTAWDVSQPVTLYNDNALPRRFIVQLCDDYDNPSTAPNVKIQLAKDPGIKFTPAPQPLKADKNGRADFGILVVSGKRGVYELQAKAFVGRNILSGPKLKVAIQPDPTKPISINVEYDETVTCVVGQNLPGNECFGWSGVDWSDVGWGGAVLFEIVYQDIKLGNKLAILKDVMYMTDSREGIKVHNTLWTSIGCGFSIDFHN